MNNGKTYVYVCISCGQHDKDIGIKSKGSGQALFEALSKELSSHNDILIKDVSCLSNCKRGVSVALSSMGKCHWLFGEKSIDDLPALKETIMAYQDKRDGFIEKSKRALPVIARIPPLQE